MTQAQRDKAHHDAMRCPTCHEVHGQCLVSINGQLRDCPDPHHAWNRPTATAPSNAQVARRFNVTPEQVRAQRLKNAAQLESMADAAAKTGRKVNGYTERELRMLATRSRNAAGALQ